MESFAECWIQCLIRKGWADENYGELEGLADTLTICVTSVNVWLEAMLVLSDYRHNFGMSWATGQDNKVKHLIF